MRGSGAGCTLPAYHWSTPPCEGEGWRKAEGEGEQEGRGRGEGEGEERVRVTERVRVRARPEVVDHATDCERGADGVAHLDGTWIGFGLGFGLRVRVS